MKKFKNIITASAVLRSPFAAGLTGSIIGGAAIAFSFIWFTPAPANVYGLRESTLNPQDSYQFIDPLLAISGINPAASSQYSDINNRVLSYINAQISEGNIQAASVYFRDMDNSGGFNINPDEKYNPASLLKVPTMMVYYNLAEDNPDILNQEVAYTGATDYNKEENLPSPIQIQPGTYTVDDLINHMIKYSDNNAAEALIENLNATGNSAAFDKLFRDLGIDQIDLTSDYITIRAYALFFRVLYNATYLDRDMSEKAMKLLTQTDFTKGLSIGVPNNTEVAQKFGEYTYEQNGMVLKRELNNCGVVYYPDHPYLLCVMTKGNDFTQLETVIGRISEMVYQYTESTYKR